MVKFKDEISVQYTGKPTRIPFTGTDSKLAPLPSRVKEE